MAFSFSSAIKGCFGNTTKYEHQARPASGNFWTNLGNDFIDSIAGGMSEEDAKKLIDAVKDKNAKLWWDLKDLDGNKAFGMLVFGLVFSICMFLGGIGALGWTLAHNRKHKKPSRRSMTRAFVAVGIAFPVLILFAASLFLYITSVDHAMDSLRPVPAQLHGVFAHVGKFMELARKEMKCVPGSIQNQFEKDLENVVEKAKDDYMLSPRLKEVLEYDFDQLTQGLKKADDSRAKIEEKLQNADDTIKNNAEPYAERMGKIFKLGNEVISKVKPKLEELKTKKDEIRNLLSVVSELGQHFDDVTTPVNKSIIGALSNNSVEVVLGMLRKIGEDVDFLEYEDSVMTLKLWVSLPSALPLLGVLIVLFCGLFYLGMMKNVPSRGCCSISCVLIVILMLTLFFNWAVMLNAGITLLASGSLNMFCKPIHEDKIYSLYPILDHLIETNGQDRKFSEIMDGCNGGKAMLDAMNAKQMLDVTEIEKSFDTTDIVKKIDSLAFPLKNYKDEGKPEYDEFVAEVSGLGNGDELAGQSDIEKELHTLATTMKSDVDAVKQKIEYLMALLKTTIAPAATELDAALKKTGKAAVENAKKGIVAETQKLLDDIIVKSTTCKNFVELFSDLEDIACAQIAPPLNSIWPASGLAAMSFIPAAVSIFLMASVVRGGNLVTEVKERKEKRRNKKKKGGKGKGKKGKKGHKTQTETDTETGTQSVMTTTSSVTQSVM